MPTLPPTVPPRESSWACLETRRVRVSESKNDLRKKLSDANILDDKEQHAKLSIQSLELDQEELYIENERLNLDYRGKSIDFKTYQKGKNQNNKRIISLGDDLWSEKRKLRKIQESHKKVELLTPDSDGAFTAALLRLYKDPKESRKRSSAIQSSMRAESITAYGADKIEECSNDIKVLRCTVTGVVDRAERIRAAHIVPYSIDLELAGYLIGDEKALRLNSADNCLMMHVDIEKAFDNGIITVIPVDPTSRPILRWKVILVNKDACNTFLRLGNFKTIGDLDGHEIIFQTEQRPSSRFLYYHFIVSLLLCRSRGNPGWEDIWLKYSKTRPYPTPGPYLRKSMLQALSRYAGNTEDFDLEEFIESHGTQCTESLAKDEESEIARRAIEFFEVDRCGCDDDCDSDNDCIGDEEQ